MSVPEEFKWLYKEIWIWRTLMIVLVIVLTVAITGQWIEVGHHEQSVERFQAKTDAFHERQIGILNKQWGVVQNNVRVTEEVRKDLQECAKCHFHPQSVMDKFGRNK